MSLFTPRDLSILEGYRYGVDMYVHIFILFVMNVN